MKEKNLKGNVRKRDKNKASTTWNDIGMKLNKTLVALVSNTTSRVPQDRRPNLHGDRRDNLKFHVRNMTTS